jgi:hypothetical protein
MNCLLTGYGIPLANEIKDVREVNIKAQTEDSLRKKELEQEIKKALLLAEKLAPDIFTDAIGVNENINFWGKLMIQ